MLVVDVTHIDSDLGVAYELKEAFRAAMALGRAGDVENFELAVAMFIVMCRRSRIPAFVTLAKTIENWKTEIVNYAKAGGASNGFAGASDLTGDHPRSDGAGL
jgi:transposase